MEKGQPTATALLDRSDRLIATLVGRFTGLVQLATAPEEENATLQTQAAMTLQLQAEMQGLVKGCEDLLKLTRELKEMWLAGPLRDIGEGDSNGAMADNAKKVLDLVEVISKKAEEMGFNTSQKQ